MADGNRRYRSDKKLYKVSFKLSEEDKRLLEEGAKKSGMNISEYLRNLVRGGSTALGRQLGAEMWMHLLRQTEGILSDR